RAQDRTKFTTTPLFEWLLWLKMKVVIRAYHSLECPRAGSVIDCRELRELRKHGLERLLYSEKLNISGD
ncbi:hypothetical protein, partial [Archaeoglobus sp.]